MVVCHDARSISHKEKYMDKSTKIITYNYSFKDKLYYIYTLSNTGERVDLITLGTHAETTAYMQGYEKASGSIFVVGNQIAQAIDTACLQWYNSNVAEKGKKPIQQEELNMSKKKVLVMVFVGLLLSPALIRVGAKAWSWYKKTYLTMPETVK